MVGGTGVEWLDDDEAFMQLVLSNTQGELSPLEIGMHALKAVPLAEGGRGKRGGISEYAERTGWSKQYLGQLRNAADVAETVNSSIRFSVADKAKHLYEISKAPEETWIVLAGETNFGLVRSCETLAHVGRTRQHTAKTS